MTTSPETNPDNEWVGLSALAAHHSRSFADVLEFYARHARGAHLGLRRSEAAELGRASSTGGGSSRPSTTRGTTSS